MEFLRNREQLLEELAQLREKQIQALRKGTYGGLTEAEQREFDDRHTRIRELLNELPDLKPAL
jgi:hypothetical protein